MYSLKSCNGSSKSGAIQNPFRLPGCGIVTGTGESATVSKPSGKTESTMSKTRARPGLSHSGKGESSFTLPSARISTSLSKVCMLVIYRDSGGGKGQENGNLAAPSRNQFRPRVSILDRIHDTVSCRLGRRQFPGMGNIAGGQGAHLMVLQSNQGHGVPIVTDKFHLKRCPMAMD